MTDMTDTLWLVRAKLDHDLRSNLNIILGYCAMLTEELKAGRNGGEGAIDDLQCIHQAGQELLRLNRQVADLQDLTLNAWTGSRGRVEVAEVIAEVYEDLQARFPDHRFELSGNATVDNADGKVMNRLFDSLLTQLCKACSTNTTVALQIEQAHDDAGVRISCEVPEHNDVDVERLQRQLQRIATPVTEMENIRDFDAYYQYVFQTLGNADLLVDVKRLACEVELKSASSGDEECGNEGNNRDDKSAGFHRG